MASVVEMTRLQAGTAVEEVHARRGHDALVEVRAAAVVADVVGADVEVGTQRTLAWVSSASATQTLACAAATISGRASESRNAVARLIGKRRSVGSNGAGLSRGGVARADGGVAAGPPRPGRAGRRRGLGASRSGARLGPPGPCRAFDGAGTASAPAGATARRPGLGADRPHQGEGGAVASPGRSPSRTARCRRHRGRQRSRDGVARPCLEARTDGSRTRRRRPASMAHAAYVVAGRLCLRPRLAPAAGGSVWR